MKKLLSMIFNNIYFSSFYLITSMTFITAFQNIPGVNLLPKIALIWGGIIALHNIFNIIKRKPNLIEYILFLFLGFTLIINLAKYPTTDNLKSWIINLILFTAMFYIDETKSKMKLKNDLLLISYIFTLFAFVFSLISIIMYFKKNQLLIGDLQYGLTIYGELCGVYTNPNSLGISSAISLIICLFIITSIKNNYIKTLCILNILLQALSLILSGCRSAYFIFIAIFAIWILLKIGKPIYRILLVAIPSISILSFIIFNSTMLLKNSSGRMNLWISAFDVIKNNILFGVGNSNLIPSVTAVRETELLGIEAGGLHNMFLQLITVNGVIAFIIFVLFIIASYITIVKCYDNNKSNFYKNYFIITSLVTGILLINLFESNILYIISFISILFWTYLGYLISLIKKDNQSI